MQRGRQPKNDAEPLERAMNVRVTRVQWERFQAFSFAYGMPVSDLIRKGIDDLLDRMEGKQDAEEE